MQPTQTDTSLIAQLRSGTAELHKFVEQQPVAQAMMQGRLTAAVWTDLLAQRWHVHQALENALQQAIDRGAAWASIIDPAQFVTEALEHDLGILDCDPGETAPGEAAIHLLDRIEAAADDDAIELLGVHYVVEGSKNGGRMLAGIVEKQLPPYLAGAVSHMRVNLDQQTASWRRFVTELDALPCHEAQRSRIVQTAVTTFQQYAEMDRRIADAHGLE